MSKNITNIMNEECPCTEPDQYLLRDELCDNQLQYYRTHQVSSRVVTVPAGSAVRGLSANPYRVGFIITTLDTLNVHTVAVRVHDSNTDPAISGQGGIIGYVGQNAFDDTPKTLPYLSEQYRRIAQANICLLNIAGPAVSVSITEILAAPGSEPAIEDH